MDAVALKSPFVQREYFINARFLRENDKGGIREVHGDIPVLYHKLGGPFKTRRGLRDKGRSALEDEFNSGSLRRR